MRIRTKLTLSACSIATLAVISIAVVMTLTASEKVETSLSLARSEQMVSLQNVTRTAVEQYTRSLENQLLDMAGQETTILAAEDMGGSFGGYALFAGQGRLDEHRSTVRDYYLTEFSDQFAALNSGSRPSVDDWVDAMSDNAITLQRHFIVDNSHPSDQRERLDEAPVSSSFNNYHKRYHPQFRRFQDRFGLDDILILRPDDGAVMYSVKKQPDVGTSLVEGPFKESHLAVAYQQAIASEPGQVVFGDFAPYAANLGLPVGFLATPIVNTEAKTVGILVFRINSDRLNQLVTYNYDWQASGLGETGTTYLAGPDQTARSNSRLLLEDPGAYQACLAKLGVTEHTAGTIVAMATNVARQRLDTAVVADALEGQSGQRLAVGISGEPVLAAFAPLDVWGQRWAVVSEIHQAEALSELVGMNQSIRQAALITAIIVAGIAALAGLILARSMTRPIDQTVQTLSAIAEGDGDLTQRLDEGRRDELGELSVAFNRFVEKIHDIVVQVKEVNHRLTLSTEQVNRHADQGIQSLAEQSLQTDQVSVAMTEMAASVEEVSGHANQADSLSREAHELAGNGVSVVNTLADTVTRMDSRTQQASHAIQELSVHSQAIGSILDVIKAIAEQTNLLALNAAIEAARAGEHGRGFAVVADEVRTLANRSQQSTEEIHTMIKLLRGLSEDAVTAMDANRTAVAEGVERAGDARTTLSGIATAMDSIAEANVSIASVVEEQSRVANEISASLLHIKQGAESTTEGSQQIAHSVGELSELNQRLQALVGRFKVR